MAESSKRQDGRRSSRSGARSARPDVQGTTLIGLGLNKMRQRAHARRHAGGARHDRARSRHLVRDRRRRGKSVRNRMSCGSTSSGTIRVRAQRARRLGRGIGSGLGKTSGRGVKGQKARAGVADQRLRRRPDAAASAPAEAWLQQSSSPRSSTRSISADPGGDRCRQGSSRQEADHRRGADGGRPDPPRRDGVRLLGKASSRPSWPSRSTAPRRAP